jgi:hypothetical protein
MPSKRCSSERATGRNKVREKLLINDVHLGVLRTGGTTQASAAAIRTYLLGKLRELMFQHRDKDIIFNGDVFDQFDVPIGDVLEFYLLCAQWLQETNHSVAARPSITLGRGNHDWAKDSSKLSSFDFVGEVLLAQFPDRVKVVTSPEMIDEEGIYMIPHMPNQDQFDLELSRIPAEARMVLVHANYDNHFAVESDHSLNVSEEQARGIVANNQILVFGHEHQARMDLGGSVFVTGNQWPSSITDCLNNPDGLKHAHVIKPSSAGLRLDYVCTWDAAKSFAEIPWGLLDGEPHEFVRVVGNATSDQAPDVIAAIAKYRQQSKAYVVTNAVKIEGVAEMEDLAVSMEEVKTFDVLSYLYENLDPAQAEVVKDLMSKRDASQLREMLVAA